MFPECVYMHPILSSKVWPPRDGKRDQVPLLQHCGAQLVQRTATTRGLGSAPTETRATH